MNNVELPKFASSNRWQTEAQETAQRKLVERGKRLYQLKMVRVAVISSLVTFVTCCLLNGVDGLPAITIKFWGAY